MFVFLLRFVTLGFTVFKGSFFGDCMNSDPGSSLQSARNASVKITKLFVKRHFSRCKKVNLVRSRFSLWENAVELF